MKKCLLLFYWACTVCMLYAQDKNTSSFLFDDFQEAVVYFKNGSQFREKMNYNILANKFYFVDRVDNKVKALSNPQDIQVIKFGTGCSIQKGIMVSRFCRRILYCMYNTKGICAKKPQKVRSANLQKQLL